MVAKLCEPFNCGRKHPTHPRCIRPDGKTRLVANLAECPLGHWKREPEPRERVYVSAVKTETANGLPKPRAARPCNDPDNMAHYLED